MMLRLVIISIMLSLPAFSADQITATITITNAAAITGTNAASVTVSNNIGITTRTFTNAVYSPSTQILVGTNASQNQQRLLIQLALYQPTGVRPSSTSPTNVTLINSNGLALMVLLSPATWGTVSYSTSTVGFPASVVRVPFSVEPAAQRTNIANQLLDGLRTYANSNAPGWFTRNLGESNATVKPIFVQIVGNTNQIYSIEAASNVVVSMTSTSIVVSVGSNGFAVTGGALTTSNAVLTGPIKLPDGIDRRMGTNTLASGTVLVTNAFVTPLSRIFLTTLRPSGTVGFPYIHSITNAVSFTITNTSTGDNSVVGWLILEPN